MRTRLYWLPLVMGFAACGSVNSVNDNDDGGTCELTECGTECVDTATDENHCGGCDMPCDSQQACIDSACENFEDFVAAELETTPRDPTGWVAPDGSPIELTFVPVEVEGATYECRTGPAMMIGSVAFGPCDGGDGTQPVHRPVPNPVMEEGSYQTEMRVRIGDFISEPVVFRFYAHRSLDSVATCPQPFTDQDIFDAVADELLVGNPPAFGPATRVRNPFITLPFTNVAPSASTQQAGSPWLGVTGNNFTVQARSLRRRFALSPNGQLLLVQRQYVSRRAAEAGETDLGRLCRNGIVYRTGIGSHNDAHVDCQTMVLNSRGFSRCVRPVNGAPSVEFPTSNGFIKLNRKSMFSPKGGGDLCPSNLFNPGACGFGYLVLPM